MLTYNNTAKEINESDIDTAILPIGSVEQHSSHLPIATDVILAKEIAAAVSKRFNALLLPTIPFSTCYEHKGVKGSICMRPITFYQMLEDIALNLKEQGFKNVIVILGHGGIFAAGPAVRELNATTDGLRVILVDPALTSNGTSALIENKELEIHAGEVETSIMLYLRETLVNKELMLNNDCEPAYPQAILNSVPMTKVSTMGTWGKPSLATREKGEKLFALRVDNAVKYIESALAISPEEKW